MKASSRDLTQGSIAGNLVRFALPVLLGQVFQNLYNSVDSIVMGNFVGMTALAAVTSSSDIAHLIVSFFTGLSSGAGVLFSRHFGGKRLDQLRRAIHTALAFSVALGLVMAAVGVLGTPLLLRLVDCPEEVYPLSVRYLRIYLVGVLFTAMYNVAAGVLRAVGDSGSPFRYLVISSVCNIALDLVLVVGLDMGIAGVAVATVISQLLSVVLIFGKMVRTQDVYRLAWRELRIEWGILGQVLSLGLPAAVQSCLTSFSNLFIQRCINGFGPAAMAGAGAAKKIDKYVSMVAQSLAHATTTLVSQNLGAEKPRRARASVGWALTLGFAAVCVIGIPAYHWAPSLLRIFTEDAAAAGYGVTMMRIMIPMYFVQTVHRILGSTLRGCGRSRTAMVTMMLGLIGSRQVYLAVITAQNCGIRQVFYAYPLGWACSALFSAICLASILRKGDLVRCEKK
ncbi:MAG: MATE family efflux transporter [Eubacteriales bacterium]|nr:MATE family efflux transporter [Eubacteriales bacterium]